MTPLTYIVRLGWKPELGELKSEGAKTYTVNQVYLVNGEPRSLSSTNRWRKDECVFPGPDALKLVEEARVVEHDYSDRIRQLHREQTDALRAFVEKIRATALPRPDGQAELPK